MYKIQVKYRCCKYSPSYVTMHLDLTFCSITPAITYSHTPEKKNSFGHQKYVDLLIKYFKYFVFLKQFIQYTKVCYKEQLKLKKNKVYPCAQTGFNMYQSSVDLTCCGDLHAKVQKLNWNKCYKLEFGCPILNSKISFI